MKGVFWGEKKTWKYDVFCSETSGISYKRLGWDLFFLYKMIFCLHFFLLLSNKYLPTVGSISHQGVNFQAGY